MSTPLSPTVDAGVACSGCAYDLRSLHVEGRCPECGQEISESIEAWERRQLPADLYPLRLCGRRFIWRLCEGVIATLLAFLLIVAVGYAPASAYAFKTPARRVLLEMLCASLVLQGFGVWRLSSRDPILPARRQRARRWLRVTLFAAYVPFFVLPQRHDASDPILPAMVVSLIGGVLISPVLLYLHVLRLGRRVGSPPVVALAVVMMLLAPLWSFFSMMPKFDGPEDSLSGLIGSPSIPFGSTEAIWAMASGRAPLSLALAALVPLLGAVTMSWLLAALTSLRRRVVNDWPDLTAREGIGGKTAASSRP